MRYIISFGSMLVFGTNCSRRLVYLTMFYSALLSGNTENTDWDVPPTASRARDALESLPSDTENIITQLEKKYKEMEKNSSGPASKQKILKGLLEKL